MDGCRCYFWFTFFIWTGNVPVTFQKLWTLHWQKPFTGKDDRMHMLRLCLAGLMDVFVIFLSPSALYPGQMPQEPDLVHCQSSIPFPSHMAAIFQQCQPVVMLQQDYILQWKGRAPQDVILDLTNLNRYCPMLIENVLFSKGLGFIIFPKYSWVTFRRSQWFLTLWKQGFKGWH